MVGRRDSVRKPWVAQILGKRQHLGLYFPVSDWKFLMVNCDSYICFLFVFAKYIFQFYLWLIYGFKTVVNFVPVFADNF